ncbi:hypothetical protein JG687_00017464 [Phytophthora cactorum]|uniref:Uncharacterized protein n=1 Tax=Phytophthora cactorum TaxID=29920 RepID=A0A8T1TS03_9STRA|nr:hypothetical protein JG687_00017464 [Phytophthora cactorum]
MGFVFLNEMRSMVGDLRCLSLFRSAEKRRLVPNASKQLTQSTSTKLPVQNITDSIL